VSCTVLYTLSSCVDIRYTYRAAPQMGQYIESPNLTKPKAERKKKMKDAETAPMIDVTHFVASAAPALVAPDATGSSSIGATTPAPRAKFAPVGSFVAHPASGDASPVPGGGSRIALSLKRKAEDDGTGTPPSKRR
jgi:U4/U6.U5 tri-snRNP-associated protein 1